jgi:hypothetical protein
LKTIISFCILYAFAASSAGACDLCGCYTPQLQTDNVSTLTEPTAVMHGGGSGLYGAIGEQFTHFGTVMVDGREVANPTGQHEESSITQIVAGYSFNRWLSVQVNVPLIYRSFKRPEGFAIDQGTESGLGDVSVLAKAILFHKEALFARKESFSNDGKPSLQANYEPDLTVSALLLAGVKFPTGDSSRLKEEFNELDIAGAPPSGIHGHDLTLGTGSFDGIFGGQASLRYKNLFFEADVQFTLRGDGLHSYSFANDLTWSGGPGYYFIRRRDSVFGLQFVVSGEHKDTDRFQGRPAVDTGITSIFLGPRIVASIGRFSGEVGVDIPISIDNTALQVVPDYRIRAGLSVRF